MSHLYRHPKGTGLYWLAYYHQGKLYRESLKTKDRATARSLQIKKDQEIYEGKYVLIKPDAACSTLLTEYGKAKEHRRTKKVNEESRSRIDRFIAWADILTLNQVTAKRLQDYLNHRINDDKVSLWEINNTIVCLKAWLSWCIMSGYLRHDPLKEIKKYKIPEKEMRFLSLAEISAVLKAAQDKALYCNHDPYLYPVVAAAIYTGMRKLELFTLRWEDVDFARKEIKISNKPGFTTKSRRNRVIPLHARLRGILEPLRQKSGPCFDVGNHRRVFARILGAAKVQDIGWHTFRHTFASQAIMAGVPLVTVSKWLGHSDIKTTLIYSHLSREHENEEIKKLSF